MNTTKTIIIIAVLSLFAMISCSTARMVNSNESIRSQVSPCNPSDELKIYELSMIWKEAEYNFAFWEKLEGTLDWEQAYKEALPRVLATNSLFEYYLELSKFVALLRDGHTGVWFPDSIWEDENLTAGLTVAFDLINDQYIIDMVDESVIDIVKPGSIVHKINGVDIEEFIETNIYPYIWHEKKDSAFYLMQDFLRRWSMNNEALFEIEYEGKIETITLQRTVYPKNWISLYKDVIQTEELRVVYESDTHIIAFAEDNIAVITINTMGNDDLPADFFANYPLLENAAGYIIDVRNNGGGNSGNGDAVSAVFIGEDFINHRMLLRIHMGTYKAWGSFQDFGDLSWEQIVENAIEEYGEEMINEPEALQWIERSYKISGKKYFEDSISFINVSDLNMPGVLNAPLVVLSSSGTASAAEDFLIALDTAKRATIVGTASYGSTGQPLMLHLESGGTVRICTIWSIYPDGREFINIGVQPHIEIENTIEDMKNGVDAVMNKGLEEVRRQIREK